MSLREVLAVFERFRAEVTLQPSHVSDGISLNCDKNGLRISGSIRLDASDEEMPSSAHAVVGLSVDGSPVFSNGFNIGTGEFSSIRSFLRELQKTLRDEAARRGRSAIDLRQQEMSAAAERLRKLMR